MRKLASIQKILSLSSIKGADRIELAHVLGWQVVVQKDQFKPGDLVVYYEIDSFLPIRPEYEFLASRCYKKNEILGEGYRLKTMTLKGEVSQGLIMPLDEVYYYPSILQSKQHRIPLSEVDDYFKNQDEVLLIPNDEKTIYEGSDLTDFLDVKEWEIPERASNSGTIIGQASGKIHVTDETRVQTSPQLLEEFRNLDYYITLKIDGSSHSIKVDNDGVFHVFGHNYEYKDDGKSSFYQFVKNNDYELMIKDYMTRTNTHSMTIQGEWAGAGIQKNKLGLKSPNWYVFTIDEDEKRVGLKEMQNFANFARDYGAPITLVPVLEQGSNLPEKYPDIESLLIRASEDNSHSYQGDIPEGIVIRPMDPVYSPTLKGPLSMKVINNKYLLKE